MVGDEWVAQSAVNISASLALQYLEQHYTRTMTKELFFHLQPKQGGCLGQRVALTAHSTEDTGGG